MTMKASKKMVRLAQQMAQTLCNSKGPCLFCQVEVPPGNVGIFTSFDAAEPQVSMLGYRLCPQCMSKGEEEIADALFAEEKKREQVDATNMSPEQVGDLINRPVH